MKRPPIVVVMGHVDHGKTTLLDYVRKTNLAAKEAGQITQSIGAYEIKHQDNKITFIDTPGHEAFSQMRERGSQIADIAILIVAADESVKQQTKEAYKIIKESKTPFVVAVNKIDKPNADLNRVKNDLAQESILLEGAGGDISWQAISAKTGEGVNELLDLILLVAEVEDLQCDTKSHGQGFILESHIDSRRGVVASIIVKEGNLKEGDEIATHNMQAKIRFMEDSAGKRIKAAEPSAPVLILGFPEVPTIGTEFIVGTSTLFQKIAGSIKAGHEEVKKIAHHLSSPLAKVDDINVINLILKANDSGSLEALSGVISALPLPEDHKLNIINQGVGDITDGDIKLAASTGALVLGFNIKISRAGESIMKSGGGEKVQVLTSSIIYELTKDFEDFLKKFKQAKILGDLEILAVFDKRSKSRQVIGGKVVEGEITNNSDCLIMRRGKDIDTGRIINLQRNKEDANKVEVGNECGLLINTETEIRAGDHLIINEDIS